jgi:hypothetical protein
VLTAGEWQVAFRLFPNVADGPIDGGKRHNGQPPAQAVASRRLDFPQPSTRFAQVLAAYNAPDKVALMPRIVSLRYSGRGNLQGAGHFYRTHRKLLE